jgi:hypothetical protein
MVVAGLLIATFMPGRARATGDQPDANERALADVLETVQAAAAKAK